MERRVRLHLASCDVDAGRYEQAERRIELLLKQDPWAARPRLLLARVARERGQITAAEQILQRAVDLGLPVSEARPEHERLRGRD